MDEERISQELRRLERMQRHIQERLDKQQIRINEQLQKAGEHIEQKAGKLSLSQERIIGAALELLKEGDLASLSLRDIANKLNIKAPALYWHFKNKSELIDYMAEAILKKEFPTFAARTENETWQDWLITAMSRLRKAMLAYPDGARVVAGAHLYPAVSLAEFSNVSILSLTSAGLSPKTAHDIVLTATHYTFGHVIEEQAAPTPEQLARVDLKAFLKRYPAMTEAIHAANTHVEHPDEAFETGLGFIIKGAPQV